MPHTNRYAVGDNRIDVTLDGGARSSLWWATKNEWLGLLDVAGLELEALYGGFAGEPFNDDSREYVFIARRGPITDHDRRAINVPVSLGISVPAVMAGPARVGAWWRRVTLKVPDRRVACLGNDMSLMLPARAWPPSTGLIRSLSGPWWP